MADTTSTPDGRIAGTVQRYLTGAETLRLTVYNSAANVRVTMSGRRLAYGATTVSEFAQSLTPTTNRLATTLDVTVGEGWLLGLAVRIVAGTPGEGQTYVVVEIGAGFGATFQPLDTLIADTLTAAHRVAWPGSPVRGPLEGPGTVRTISGTTPGAGAEISETVPTGARWELIALRAVLTTAVAVANRLPRFTFDDGLTTFYNTPCTNAHVASTTIGYQLLPGAAQQYTDSISNSFEVVPANLRLLGTWRIRSLTNSLQAADQWSAVVYAVREWLEGS
jgi:hypothetical protein